MPALFRDERDFPEIFGVAAESLELPPAVIEKDYWVTQALRGLADAYPQRFVFKGGTSLSKAYHLIHRFSEDIDVLVFVEEQEGAGAIDSRMKEMGRSAAKPLGCEPKRRRGGRGQHRTVALRYPTEHTAAGIEESILLEMGTAGGIRPHKSIPIGTLLGEVLDERGRLESGEFSDLDLFDVPVLHPGRTLIEKLILVNTVAERFARGELEAEGLAQLRVGRHFYDIHCLLGDSTATDLLTDRPEFERICTETIQISREHYETAIERPVEGYGSGPAFTGPANVLSALGAQYVETMDVFYYGTEPYPSFEQIRTRVQERAAVL